MWFRRGRGRGVGVLALAGALMVWTAVSPAGSRGAGTAVRMTPSAQTVAPGAIAQIDVDVEDTLPLGAWEVRMEWDPTVLRYSGVTTGTFLSSTGRQAKCVTPVVGEGYVQFGCGTTGAVPPGPSGDGALGSVRLEAIAAGTTDVVFTKIELTNEDANNPITPSSFDTAVVQVRAPGEPAATPRATSTPNSRRLTPTPVTNAPTPADSCRLTENNCADPLAGSVPQADVTPGAGTIGVVDAAPRPSSPAGGAVRGGANAPVAGYGPQSQHDDRPMQAAWAVLVVGTIVAVFGAGVRQRAARRRY